MNCWLRCYRSTPQIRAWVATAVTRRRRWVPRRHLPRGPPAGATGRLTPTLPPHTFLQTTGHSTWSVLLTYAYYSHTRLTSPPLPVTTYQWKHWTLVQQNRLCEKTPVATNKSTAWLFIITLYLIEFKLKIFLTHFNKSKLWPYKYVFSVFKFNRFSYVSLFIYQFLRLCSKKQKKLDYDVPNDSGFRVCAISRVCC